ncbi:MAG: DUF1559 domain-containing protein [Pirellulales bacterium]|nr:DUF1559 domain-containing protein [Pirellulales bacterium]
MWLPRYTLRGLLLFVTVISVLLAIVVPVYRTGGDQANKAQCTSNLKIVVGALEGYELCYGRLPPAFLADESGKPIHSWRVLVLPFLGRKDLYDKYDFNEPWDGPNNRLLSKDIPSEYRCPKIRNANKFATSYVAVIGPRTLWRGARGVSRKELADQWHETILLMEIAESDIHWMEPRDISTDFVIRQLGEKVVDRKPSIVSHGGIRCISLTSNLYRLPQDCPPDVIMSLLRTDDGTAKGVWNYR